MITEAKRLEYNANLRERYRTDPEYRRRQYESHTRRLESKRNFLVNVRVQFGCSECDEDHYSCLDFHHVDPAEKEKDMGSIVSHSWENIVKELEKCEIMCRNCHAKFHEREMSVIEIKAKRSGTAKMKQSDMEFPAEFQRELNL